MRRLAESYVRSTGADPGDGVPAGLLCEAEHKAPYVYVLGPGGDERTARLERFEAGAIPTRSLPFLHKGRQAPFLTPVFKVSYYPKPDRPGIAVSRRASTLRFFRDCQDGEGYFPDVLEILEASRLELPGGGMADRGEGISALDLAVDFIDAKATKQTVVLAIRTDRGLPGEDGRFRRWFATCRERLGVYLHKRAEPSDTERACPLCGADAVLFPNAVAGAGINVANMDLAGSFPTSDIAQAWKRFGICLHCADLLYVYTQWVASRFKADIAGRRALVIPFADVADPACLAEFHRLVEEVCGLRDTALAEEDILEEIAGRSTGVATVTILWAKLGQKLEDVTDAVTHVLPSRLAELSYLNHEVNRLTGRCLPQAALGQGRARLDLHLGALATLLRLQGGRRVKKDNASQRLSRLLTSIAGAVYRGRRVRKAALWTQIGRCAEAWHRTLLGQRNPFVLYQCLHELPRSGKVPKGAERGPVTLAGWVRHVHLLLVYLDRTEVLPMPPAAYTPSEEGLAEVFADARGIDTDGKAFAFLLGALFGKLVAVQAARRVSVAANSLKWLRGMRLRAADLPELYVRVRGKLLVYGTEGSADVRALLRELGRIGTRRGADLDVPDDQVAYFLLLGQSLSTELLPSSRKDLEDADDERST